MTNNERNQTSGRGNACRNTLAYKNDRQRALQRIVRTYRVCEQSKFIDLLRSEGLDTSRVTVGRDLVELGIAKTKYGFYAFHEDEELMVALESYGIGIELIQNQCVVRTKPSGATIVASAIENVCFRGVAATLTGVNSAVVICRGADSAEEIASFMSKYVPV